MFEDGRAVLCCAVCSLLDATCGSRTALAAAKCGGAGKLCLGLRPNGFAGRCCCLPNAASTLRVVQPSTRGGDDFDPCCQGLGCRQAAVIHAGPTSCWALLLCMPISLHVPSLGMVLCWRVVELNAAGMHSTRTPWRAWLCSSAVHPVGSEHCTAPVCHGQAATRAPGKAVAPPTSMARLLCP